MRNISKQFNTLRPRQHGRRFADDTFKPIFFNENIRISINIPLKFVPKVPINNNPALIQIMAWRRPGDKPLSESMMVCLLTHICVTRPQWVKTGGDFTWHVLSVGNVLYPTIQNERWHLTKYRDAFPLNLVAIFIILNYRATVCHMGV